MNKIPEQSTAREAYATTEGYKVKFFETATANQLDRIEAKLDKLLERKKPKPRAAKKFEYPKIFEKDFWEAYPCTKGGNKKKTYAIVQQRIKEDPTDYQKMMV